MKILIIEDEIGIANFLKQGLEEEGYDVLTASNGQYGLDLALTVEVDLILLDWMLPKITGIEVCKIIRKSNTTVPIPFKKQLKV